MVGGCYKTLTVISNYYGSKKESEEKGEEKLISILLKIKSPLQRGFYFLTIRLRRFLSVPCTL